MKCLVLQIFYQQETDMALKCDLCGKGPQYGNVVSHANNTRRRRWNPNLKRVRAVVAGTHKHLRVCTACIRAQVIKPGAAAHRKLLELISLHPCARTQRGWFPLPQAGLFSRCGFSFAFGWLRQPGSAVAGCLGQRQRTDIKREAVDKYYRTRVSPEGQEPSQEESLSLKLNILDELINNEILLERAKKLNLVAKRR